MTLRVRYWPLAAVSAGALLLAGSPAAAAPRSYTVVVDKLKFGPVPAVLHKGDTIVWVNKDFLKHSATATDHSFDLDLAAGAKGATVLKKTGAIAFVCRYHPGMRGVLNVK
jgi:plastocyanin